MKISMIGLGKLGLPVAVSMALQGHNVMGYDLDPRRMSRGAQPYQEAGPKGEGDFNNWLLESSIRFGSLIEVAEHAEIIFVAVQTPHQSQFEGITPLPPERADFDYSHLRDAVETLAGVVKRPTVIAVISTVLPGTMRREIMPLCNEHMRLIYNPLFIAMGMTMEDFLKPEFVLIGADDKDAASALTWFYIETLGTLTSYGANQYVYEGGPQIRSVTLESAELTKVAYNTYIGQKIIFANTIMEICDRIPEADCDQVIDTLALADRRLMSPAYLRGGMGDGGGCHPRDNIAMSFLADKLNLSHDLFDDVMAAREDQARWLADMMKAVAEERGLQMAVLGYAYKPESNLTVGSAALLVISFLDGKATIIDPFVDDLLDSVNVARVYLIGCKHECFKQWSFPDGSVVIDPWRYIPDREGIEVMRLGERQEAIVFNEAGEASS